MALWASFILLFEPVERDLYDTRTFTENAMRMIDQTPAPLVLHGMGKDAKAIKFMVNLNRDLMPVFTQSAVELQNVGKPVWVVMDRKDYVQLQGTPAGDSAPTLSGRFDKNDYVLLYVP